jgi:YD repeat-containing protein
MRKSGCVSWRHIAVVVLAALSLFQVTPAPAANGSVVYTYDALGRIATASYDTGVIIIYTYDANGNRISQVINVNSSVGSWGSFTWGAAVW